MALLKDVTYKGVVCNYHKIWSNDVKFSAPAPGIDVYTKMDVTVVTYKNLAARTADVENFLRTKTYHFFSTDDICPAHEKINKIYKALKELPEYDEAEDA